VLPYTAPTTTTEEADAGAGAGRTGDREVGKAVMTLNYSDSVVVGKGESLLMFVEVMAGAVTGNQSLNDVIFRGKSMGIPYFVTPDKIYRIEAGKESFFLITLNVPRAIDAGEYFLQFSVASDETHKNGTIKVNVKELEEKEDLWRIIQNYRFIIARLKWEMRQASLDGANVTAASDFLFKAENEVDAAESFYNDSNYDATKEQLALAKA